MLNWTEYFTLLHPFAAFVQTAEGSNALFAAICVAALLGTPSRLCLVVTLLAHLVLIAL